MLQWNITHLFLQQSNSVLLKKKKLKHFYESTHKKFIKPTIIVIILHFSLLNKWIRWLDKNRWLCHFCSIIIIDGFKWLLVTSSILIHACIYTKISVIELYWELKSFVTMRTVYIFCIRWPAFSRKWVYRRENHY